MRRLICAALAALAGISGCQPDDGVTPDPRTTTVTEILDLGALAGHTWSVAESINDRGQIAGSSGYTFVYPDTGHYRQRFQVSRPFVWHNGQMADLSGLGQSTLNLSVANAINTSGVVAGMYSGPDYYTQGSGGWRPALYREGRIEILPLVPGLERYGSGVTGLDDAGNVVGGAAFQTPVGVRRLPALWRSGASRPEPLITGIPQGFAFAVAINNRGQAVGYVENSLGEAQAALFENGRTVLLPSLPGHRTSRAEAINNRGEVVGISSLHSAASGGGFGYFRAVLWRQGRVVDLGVHPADSGSIAFGINDHGDVVGMSVTETTSRAVLWRGGNVLDLGRLPGSAGREHEPARPRDINNRGQVVGSIGDRAVRWTISPAAPD